MDSELIRTIAEVSLQLLTLGVAVSAHLRKGWESKIDKLADANNDLADKNDKLEGRVLGIERDMRHLPDKEVTHRMEMAIERLSGKLETMDERLKPVSAMANRMQDYILENERA